jgi:peptide/nickel transport system substrate-binding protein
MTASYTALDDHTLEWVGLPGCTGADVLTNFFTPLPRHILAELVADGGVAAIEDSDYARHPVGWGPFRVEEWVQGDHITLERNPNYYRAAEGLPRLDRVVFRFIGDYSLASAMLLAGEVDIVVPEILLPSIYDGSFYSHLEMLESWDEQGTLELHAVPYPLWEHIDFNVDPVGGNDFFNDVRVRQAVAYGTNRQAMIDEAMMGATGILDTYLPTQHPLHAPLDGVSRYDYQPDVARQLLSDAGWELGNDGLLHRDGEVFSVTLMTTEALFRGRIMDIFQENMADLGIEVQVQYATITDLYASGPEGKMMGRTFDLVQFGWYDRSLEPACELYTTSQIPGESTGWWGLNFTGWSNAEYDAACTAGLSTLHRDARASHFYRTQELFSEELPVLPLFLRLKVSAAQPRVRNYRPDASEFGELWNIEEIYVVP